MRDRDNVYMRSTYSNRSLKITADFLPWKHLKTATQRQVLEKSSLATAEIISIKAHFG